MIVRAPRFWIVLTYFAFVWLAKAQTGVWRFVVSGDSRDCGDVVMPAIASGTLADGAEFYWHLGDFRAINRFDADYVQQQKLAEVSSYNIEAYFRNAWPDFIENQIHPFGSLPVFLAFGNHEVVYPMTTDHLLATFSFWLNAPIIREQRIKDHDEAVEGYYHWKKDGIDFITLDNSTSDFDPTQMKWIEHLLSRDKADEAVRAVVVGMHEALPESISGDHSMEETPEGNSHGLLVYKWLLELKSANKAVYLLASHSHYYMAGNFNTEYWRTHGGVLPGWIIGTAGALRMPLPPASKEAIDARAHVYGYLLATVNRSKDDPVRFEFKELKTSAVPLSVVTRFTPQFVEACWTGNPPLQNNARTR